jgi:hypothetical protein
MFYPTSCGTADGKDLRLPTLDAIWIRGKLSMWGRWSKMGSSGAVQNIFGRLMSEKKLSKGAIQKAITQMKKAGISKEDLFFYFGDPDNVKARSALMYCTDAEALLMDAVIGEVLSPFPGLIDVVQAHYKSGMNKLEIAKRMNKDHSEISLSTCRRRIDVWLLTAEYILFSPMREAFGRAPIKKVEKILTY